LLLINHIHHASAVEFAIELDVDVTHEMNETNFLENGSRNSRENAIML